MSTFNVNFAELIAHLDAETPDADNLGRITVASSAHTPRRRPSRTHLQSPCLP